LAPFKNLTAPDLALWLWGTRREGGQDWLLTEAKIAATFGEVDETLDAALVLVGKVLGGEISPQVGELLTKGPSSVSAIPTVRTGRVPSASRALTPSAFA
jgi:hypothetical protein